MERPSIDDRSTRWRMPLLVFALFLLVSTVRAPVPAVNEPHYLTKAKHYWQPHWCAGDLFLESADAHLVFYQTVGWLTQFLTLPTTAWVTRCAALFLLATGWDRLARCLVPHRWAGVLSASLFMMLAALGNLSGEWLIGGVESKVFAYGLLFWGIAGRLESRFLLAGILLGLSISFHPIVGLWGLIGLLGVESIRVAGLCPTMTAGESLSFTQSRFVAGAVALILCSLPGLIPAVRLLMTADPEQANQANFIQVAFRLSHHLDPLEFSLVDYRYYLMMCIASGVIYAANGNEPVNPRRRWFEWFVGFAFLIALCGYIAGWGERPIHLMPWYALRLKLLKLYPFRLIDVLLPMLLAISIAHLLLRGVMSGATTGERMPGTRPPWSAIVVTLLAMSTTLGLPSKDANPSRLSADDLRDWKDLLDWVERETPEDAMICAIDENWSVKWFAQRPEYVNYKDCPQDAPSIVEWNARLIRLKTWQRQLGRDGRVSAEALADLHADGIDFLLCNRSGRGDVEPIYEKGRFRVYDLRDD